MKNRGLGFVYQPKYRDKGTGELRTAATWWISYSDHGKRIRENAHTENHAAAVRTLKERIGRVGRGEAVGPQLERTTLDDLLILVADDYKNNGRRSADRVAQASTRLREYFGEHRRAREIEDVSAYQAQRLEDGAARSTVNYECAILRRGFRLALKKRRVASVPNFDLLHVSNARQGFFEREQYEAVVRHLPEDLKVVARVAFITGWRANSELLSRQWRHANFEAGCLRLDAGETKNGEGREFPFTPELRAIMEAQLARVKQIQRSTGQVVPCLFFRFGGQGRAAVGSRIKDLRGAWKRACRDAGVPGRLIHDFRRTAVRNLIRAGVPTEVAMKLTGHKSQEVFRRYAIIDEGMKREAVAKLAALHASEAKCQSTVKVSAFGADN